MGVALKKKNFPALISFVCVVMREKMPSVRKKTTTQNLCKRQLAAMETAKSSFYNQQSVAN